MSTRRWAWRLVGALAGLALAFGAWVAWASSSDDPPDPVLPFPIHAPPSAPPSAPTPSGLRVLTWNIAYARGPGWDLGEPDCAAFERNLETIAAQIERHRPDLVALQEVDLGSDRSCRVDQAAWLRRRLPDWPYEAHVTVWKLNHLPWPLWPPSRHMGQVHQGQAVLSRYPLVRNVRLRYPQPASYGAIKNRFFLKRAAQWVTVELGELELDLYSVHLESRDPPTRRLQTLRLAEDLQGRAGPLALAVGDFNALPMRAEVRRGFDDNPWADFRGDDCLARFSEQLPGWREVWEDRAEREGYTFPALSPNRKLDHQWAAPGLGVARAEVLDLGPGAPSDHRPLLVDYSLP